MSMLHKKENNKRNLILEIQKASQLYKRNLVGRKFLYIFEAKSVEMIFPSRNFKHLTGVESNLSSSEFYKTAVRSRLRVSDIYFSKQHPYDLCVRKIKHLSNISDLSAGEGFMLEDISTFTKRYKIGATNLNFTLCFNRPLNLNKEPIGECMHIESLRDEDCFKKSLNVYEITHILSKRNDEKLYNTLNYIDKRYSISDVPISLKNFISCDLFEK